MSRSWKKHPPRRQKRPVHLARKLAKRATQRMARELAHAELQVNRMAIDTAYVQNRIVNADWWTRIVRVFRPKAGLPVPIAGRF